MNNSAPAQAAAAEQAAASSPKNGKDARPNAEGPKEGKGKLPLKERIWGRSAKLALWERRVTLVFVVASMLSMSFTQLGFWSIGIIDAKPVYLLLLLGPLTMGAVIYGPLMGALLGLFAGLVVYTHAQVFPLSGYEVYFMSSLNTFVLLTFFGAVSGWLFDVFLNRNPKGAARMGVIAAVCVAMSLLASALISLNAIIIYGGPDNIQAIREILLLGPLGFIVQAFLDAALMAVLAIVSDAVLQAYLANKGEHRLFSMFRNWMFLISSIVFMLASGIIFSVATVQAQNNAGEVMKGEVEYLQMQMAQGQGYDYKSLIEGYESDLDGVVLIIDENGIITTTDSKDRYPVGGSFVDIIGYGNAGYETVELLEALVSENDGVNIIDCTDENGVDTMDYEYIAAGKVDNGYVIMMRHSELVYRSRVEVMASSTALALMLILSVALVALNLLKFSIVDRIDETNRSLEKITEGNLKERVNVRGSREFASLSNGINTMVSALKRYIVEAKQLNAQELATAKAIQESSLPRESPPFPEIDRFDIYASMKTAKEVGGDFYDYFIIEDGKLGFVMADVSGKGIPAALFMMTAKAQIRTYMEAGLPLDEAVSATNHQLCIGNDASMFVTMYACILDYRTGELTCVNAGHNPPLLRHGESWEWLKKVSGVPLGLYDGVSYKKLSWQLDEGDILYLYTDGVTEAMSDADELFGEGRLLETLLLYDSMNPRSMCVGVRRAITEFTLDAEQSDDITMLCLKYGVPPEKKAVMILPAVDNQLIHVYNFIHAELDRRGAPKSVYNPLDIAAEELFVNVCHYAYPEATPDNPGEARISFVYEANPPSLTVEIADDGIPYNPLEKPDAVTPDDIMEVPIGGLGILMAKRSVDDMDYRREGNSNILTIRKVW